MLEDVRPTGNPDLVCKMASWVDEKVNACVALADVYCASTNAGRALPSPNCIVSLIHRLVIMNKDVDVVAKRMCEVRVRVRTRDTHDHDVTDRASAARKQTAPPFFTTLIP